MASMPPTLLQQAIDRLVFETQYVRDVLHVSGPQGSICQISAVSMQRLFDGLAWSIDTLRAAQASPMTPIVPTGGAAPPEAGG